MSQANNTLSSDVEGDFSTEQMEYLDELNGVVEIIKRNTNDSYLGWYIIGGLPIDAYTQNVDFRTTSREKTIRDIDVIPFRSLIPNLIEAKRESPSRVQIDMVYHSVLRLESDSAILKLGKYEVELNPSLFDTRMVELGGVIFPTLSPQTLLHLYTVGIAIHGSIREKDFHNALRLARYAKQQGENYPHDDDYRPFHEFLKISGYKENLLLNLMRMYRRLNFQKYIHPDSPTLQPYMEFIWNLLNR